VKSLPLIDMSRLCRSTKHSSMSTSIKMSHQIPYVTQPKLSLLLAVKFVRLVGLQCKCTSNK
jgi:hypothetical protein